MKQNPRLEKYLRMPLAELQRLSLKNTDEFCDGCERTVKEIDDLEIEWSLIQEAIAIKVGELRGALKG